MQFTRRPNSFTLIELLVVISIIALLAGLATPALMKALTQGQLVQALNNERQIHMGVQSAALEVTTTGSGLGWPSTNYTSAPAYFTALIKSNIFQWADAKIFIAAGPFKAATASQGTVETGNIAFKVYSVDEADDGNVVFLTTKNFKYTASGNDGISGSPFGTKGFVVFRKGGDGLFYTKVESAKDTNTIGSLPSAATTASGPLSD